MTQSGFASTRNESSEKTRKNIPNFFIGGAPKSGTTAMASYLRDHPNIFFTHHKEPLYWANDLVHIRERDGVSFEDEYFKLFSDIEKDHMAVGEGSTLYLYSKNAIKNIKQNVPDSKFIFMVRNPVEIAHGYHMQMVFNQFEDTESFEKAWELQSERAKGNRIPAKCVEPSLLQYKNIASVGSQLENTLEQVERERVHLILFDDFVSDPQREYQRVLEFLNLHDDGRNEFQKVNAAMKIRFGWASHLLKGKASNRLTGFLKRHLSGRLYQGARAIKHFFLLKREQREELQPEFKRQLKTEFAQEVEKLEKILERDLSNWK